MNIEQYDKNGRLANSVTRDVAAAAVKSKHLLNERHVLITAREINIMNIQFATNVSHS